MTSITAPFDRPGAPAVRLPIDRQVLGLVLMLLVLVLALYATEPRFASRLNILNIERNASFLLIVAAGQMMVMIVGGYDLSVGAAIALASVVSSTVMTRLFEAYPDQVALSIAAGCVVALLSAAAIGAVNGACVALLGMPPFMVTLGTLSIASGAAFYITHGMPVYGMPTAFTEDFGRAVWIGVPAVTVIAMVIVAGLVVVQRRTALGRHLYAIGGNVQAARQSGLSVKTGLFSTYVVCSLLAGITGLLLTARIGSGQANLGSDLMLQSIGAAVLGGASLRGGIGRVERLVLSSLLLTLIANGMNLIRMESKIQTIVLGVLLIAFVALGSLRKGSTQE
ncbi:ABC transporter permease [Acidovorax sp. MR-S7]|uniref:ABC transporter permease n=1 Tax=Acidovorax sp. MR-S7 TaxID=1268622 RepID=UPI000382578A|nr:ABC transporter permease [Acidovorax sp. MR-S7]